MASNVTLQQVGQRAKVSMMTASRVLNGHSGSSVRASTRRRVLEAALELGYRTHTAAQAMAQGRFNNIALLLSIDQGHSELPQQMLRGVAETLEANGRHLSLSILSDEWLTDEHYMPRILRDQHADGLLVNYTHQIPQPMLDLIERHELPSVLMNVRAEHDCVYPDDRDAGRRATEHLIALGHTRIAYLDYSHGQAELAHKHYSARDRALGYEQAMHAAGLTPRIIRPAVAPVPYVERRAFTRDWLTAPDRPTAVVAYADDVASVVVLTCRELGVAIADELSIVAFSAGVAARHIGVDLTTLRVPDRYVGQAAVEMILRKTEAPAERLPGRAIPCDFHDGGSCVPPKV